MDSNKAKKLLEIEYTIQKCCGLCRYSYISLDGWGTCNLHKYKHEKHTGEERQLSINQFGYCDKFEINQTKAKSFQAYHKLIDK